MRSRKNPDTERAALERFENYLPQVHRLSVSKNESSLPIQEVWYALRQFLEKKIKEKKKA